MNPVPRFLQQDFLAPSSHLFPDLVSRAKQTLL